ncbi:MAG: hypothetical protein R6X10_07640 [Desulfobacterales bacterium]
MAPEEIAEGCQEAFQKYSFVQRGLQLMRVAVLAAGVLVISQFVTKHLPPGKWIAAPSLSPIVADPYLQFSLALILLTTIILAAVSRGRLWQFGIISPVGKNWWLTLPIGILGAFAGGAWMPAKHPSYQIADISRLLLGGMLLAFASEYLFRGVLHGILARQARIQSCGSKFFISWPNIGTAFLYALFLALLPFFQNETFIPYPITLKQGSIYFAGFFSSLVLGSVRERSHSVFSSFLIHFIAVLTILFLPDFLIYLYLL